MGMHTIAEAGERLRELVAEAAAGEAVVLTHEGVAVAELRAISPPRSQGPGRPVTRADLDWLAELRRGLGKPSSTDAATFISDMRDEGER